MENNFGLGRLQFHFCSPAAISIFDVNKVGNFSQTGNVKSMIRLLYISQAAPGISADQVQDILLSSRRNNPAFGITGVLVHGGGLFMQVLEGPERAVLRLYVKILDDVRHGDCRIVHISPASERIFDEWSMGIIESDPLGFQHIADLRARRMESVQVSEFRAVMSAFLQNLKPRSRVHATA